MDRSTRTLLLTGATIIAALSLTFPSALAEEEAASEDMASMAPMAEVTPGLLVQDAWTRESPMADLAGAAYMVIHNSTDADDALVGVSSPMAEFAELHLSSMDDEGMMSMRQVTEIPVPAHGEAVLEPGSYHIMLINLSAPLTEGVEVELELTFMTAEPQTVVAPVMASAPMGDMDMGAEMNMGMGADETGVEDLPESDDTEPDED